MSRVRKGSKMPEMKKHQRKDKEYEGNSSMNQSSQQALMRKEGSTGKKGN